LHFTLSPQFLGINDQLIDSNILKLKLHSFHQNFSQNSLPDREKWVLVDLPSREEVEGSFNRRWKKYRGRK